MKRAAELYYIRSITSKHVACLQVPTPRHCVRAAQLFLKKCRSDGEPLATLCTNLHIPVTPQSSHNFFTQTAFNTPAV